MELINACIVMLVAIVFTIVNFYVFTNITKSVSTPYMDEIFHVPQARHYCHGNYTEWNDKITTLPGLYIYSTIVLKSLSFATNININDLCTTYSLRLTNLFMLTATFILLNKLFLQLHNQTISFKVVLLNSLALVLFPLNYFFQYMYYTDVGSTFFCLLSYYYQLKSSFKLSSLFALVAILYRQTNVVWIAFYVMITLLNNVDMVVRKHTKDSTRQQNVSHLFDLVTTKPATNTNFNLFKSITNIISEDLLKKKRVIIRNLYDVIKVRQLLPYVVLLIGFFIFVHINNGIVVGDRKNHEVSIHVCQLFYFFTFSAVFAFTHVFVSIQRVFSMFGNLFINKFKITLLVVMLFCVIIHNFTYEHPFLLADNRHYTFYLWSKIIKRHSTIKYLLSIVYLYSLYAFYKSLIDNKKTIGWLIAYTLAIIVCLIPQKLIEFRYFIIPYFIFRLNIKCYSIKHVLVELLLYVLINSATIYLFIKRVFYWPQSNEPQRFMW